MAYTQRQTRESAAIAITNNSTTSGGIPIGAFAGGVLMLDSTSTGAAVTLNWYVRQSPSGSTAYRLNDAAGNALSSVVGPSQACELPTNAFGSAWLIPVISGAATASGAFTLKG